MNDDPSPSAIIPIANPAVASQYLRLGERIAAKRGGTLLLLHLVVEVASSDAEDAGSAGASETDPSGTAPSDGSSGRVITSSEAENIVRRIREAADSLNVPVETKIREAHSIAEGIVLAAHDEGAEYLIMGWRGDLNGGRSEIGSDIEGVVRESRSHTIIMQRGELREMERILVPVANPKTAPLALAVASLLRGDTGPKVDVLHLSPVRLNEQEKADFCSALFELVDETEHGPEALFTDISHFDVIFEMQDDPAVELAARSKDYDRMVVGTSKSDAGKEVFGKLPMQIAQGAQCPIIFVRPKSA